MHKEFCERVSMKISPSWMPRPNFMKIALFIRAVESHKPKLQQLAKKWGQDCIFAFLEKQRCGVRLALSSLSGMVVGRFYVLF